MCVVVLSVCLLFFVGVCACLCVHVRVHAYIVCVYIHICIHALCMCDWCACACVYFCMIRNHNNVGMAWGDLLYIYVYTLLYIIYIAKFKMRKELAKVGYIELNIEQS